MVKVPPRIDEQGSILCPFHNEPVHHFMAGPSSQHPGKQFYRCREVEGNQDCPGFWWDEDLFRNGTPETVSAYYTSHHELNHVPVPVTPRARRDASTPGNSVPGPQATSQGETTPSTSAGAVASDAFSLEDLDNWINATEREAAKHLEEAERLKKLRKRVVDLERDKLVAERTAAAKTDYIAALEGLRKN